MCFTPFSGDAANCKLFFARCTPLFEVCASSRSICRSVWLCSKEAVAPFAPPRRVASALTGIEKRQARPQKGGFFFFLPYIHYCSNVCMHSVHWTPLSKSCLKEGFCSSQLHGNQSKCSLGTRTWRRLMKPFPVNMKRVSGVLCEHFKWRIHYYFWFCFLLYSIYRARVNLTLWQSFPFSFFFLTFFGAILKQSTNVMVAASQVSCAYRLILQHL